MIQKLSAWLDERTGWCTAWKRFLEYSIPGGPRWRYTWGTMLAFAFFLEAVTGLLLWMAYSPSTQTAWESTYFIQHEMTLGWLIRGVHHYAAHTLMVLMGLHFLQTIFYRVYLQPREVNFWVGLALLQVLMLIFLTGFLLPWDQYGYHGSVARNKILGTAPFVGQPTLAIAQGGKTFGHQTLTRFFALHAGLLPAIALGLFVVYAKLVFRQGVAVGETSLKPAVRYWPDQALRDGIACLGVLAVAVGLTLGIGAPLWGPANTVDAFGAARPEWEFLFLFRFLKMEFIQKYGTEVGAVYVPTLIIGVIVLMPFIGRTRAGHIFNLSFLGVLLAAMGYLSFIAVKEDAADLEYQAAFQEAEREGHRSVELAAAMGIPAGGALELVQQDPLFMGPKLFARHCASCHRLDGKNGLGADVWKVTLKPDHTKDFVAEPASAADLAGFGSRAWMMKVLTDYDATFAPLKNATFSEKNVGERFLAGDMAGWCKDNLEVLKQAENAESVKALVEFLAKQSGRKDLLPFDEKLVATGRDIFETGTLKSGAFSGACTDCHGMHAVGEETAVSENQGVGAPTLTGYGGRKWLIDFLKNPGHADFYGENNAMPGFERSMSQPEIELLVDWMLGDYYRPEAQAAGQ